MNQKQDYNEIKELNERLDNIDLNFNNDNNHEDFKTKYTYFLFTGLFIVLIVSMVAGEGNRLNSILLFSASVAFFLLNVISPYRKHLKNGTLRRKSVILYLCITTAITISFSISVYLVYISNRYNLRYSYWICLFGFIVLIFQPAIGSLINNLKQKKSEEKKVTTLKSIGYIILIAILLYYQYPNFKDYIFVPQKQIYLKTIQMPRKITIYQYNNNNGKRKLVNMLHIRNEEIINRILSELSEKTYTNISATESFNFDKMKEYNAPYYQISLNFNVPSDTEQWFPKTVNADLVITSNRNTAIEVKKFHEGLLTFRHSKKIYPVILPEDTLDLLDYTILYGNDAR
ncbi:hypothetical protein I5677_08605 [Mobilitalea sibirica]|uniref:Uncharacterized protein n=1 Tax=Mobilitalea sibirica TaxID=1462919 RepID=A0A8J7H2F0_9FIRM|nr:hypothetical protein [Mobilitalea sibirica]MBH1940949.1 hypothetical protein [Mobilitalea sibirica]